MAQILPPIFSAKSSRSFRRESNKLPPAVSRHSSAIASTGVPAASFLSTSPHPNKFEKEFYKKQEKLANQLPKLDPFQISEYKSDALQNTCTYLLRKGLHKSFQEIVRLMRMQEEMREKAGRDSFLWQEPLLSDQPKKLESIKMHLEEAEKRMLEGDFERVYTQHKMLAEQFTAPEDAWLRLHFFTNCLEWSRLVEGDDHRLESEANRNIGYCFSSSGDIVKALHHFELAQQLRRGHKDNDGLQYYRESCVDLAKITVQLASLRTKNVDESFALYTTALEAAVESKDEKIIADCNYNLGHMHAHNGDPQLAIKHLGEYYTYCLTADDVKGIARSCQDFSKAYERNGNMEETLRYLDKFMQVADRTKNESIVINANSVLGVRLNSLRQYEKASECFERAFTLSRKKKKVPTATLR